MARVEAGNRPAWAIPMSSRPANSITNPVVASTHIVPAEIATVAAPSMPKRNSARRGPQ